MKKVLFNIILLTLMQSALGQTATFYDFNTAGQLSNLFNGVGETVNVSQLTTGGIGNSGCINLPGGTNAIFSTKEGYSLGPAGSSDTFQSFIKSLGPNGYSGVGFTASAPVSASLDGYYRPTDAIGISVHGGGFIFHNGSTNYTGLWSGSSLDAGITATKTATATSDNLIDNSSITEGSPDRWYKIVFKMTRATLSTFDMRVEVWPSNADGTIRYTTASAIFEVKGVTNTALSNAPILHSYFNFAGDRVRNFDNFTINLTGGGSVIQAGAPVVLTSSGSESSGTITANGEVTSENGGTVTERGFVYATTVDPTIANTKVVSSGSGLGTFTGTISGLSAATTYYLRAYATNSAGTTSYGSDLSFTTAIAISRLNSYGGHASDDISYHVNRNGEIGVSSLTRYGEEVFYVPKHSGAVVLVSSTETTANLTSTIATTGGKAITTRGICWRTTANPTTADNKTVDGSGKGSFNSAITGLTKETTYYVRTYATNAIGTSYGAEMSFTTPRPSLAIGDAYEGGVIAYFLVSGDTGYSATVQHGLIVSTTNQVTGFSSTYGPFPTNIVTGAKGTSIGTGLTNTNTIIAVQGSGNTYAATMARAYKGSGYTDWYLPSKDELSALYSNKTAINIGLTAISGSSAIGDYYLSSTESSSPREDLIWCLFDKQIIETNKGVAFPVRAVRSF